MVPSGSSPPLLPSTHTLTHHNPYWLTLPLTTPPPPTHLRIVTFGWYRRHLCSLWQCSVRDGRRASSSSSRCCCCTSCRWLSGWIAKREETFVRIFPFVCLLRRRVIEQRRKCNCRHTRTHGRCQYSHAGREERELRRRENKESTPEGFDRSFDVVQRDTL